MNLPQLQRGKLVRRYQRFLADIELTDGSIITVHTPNTGSMRQCAVAGYAVMFSRSGNEKRKYAHTLELIEVDGAWVDINTHRSNKVVAEALRLGNISGLRGFDIYPEQTLGESRIDFKLQKGDERLWLEVKNVTLMGSRVCASFPDAVTERGKRHLQELMVAKHNGDRAVIMFLIQRSAAKLFSPAADIDPAYAEQLSLALDAGVEPYACQTETTTAYTKIVRRLPVVV
ncbi:MAG: sugar fermentation stimulation protein SfsA [Desulfobacteraceae bacterium 4572_35.1]|nr:MAG: sugar fermentation stimulation protein SfsA [Desulfobacteraceae bacterium 4572_35.1]